MKPRKRTPLADRLWARVERRASGCWEWTGAVSPKGYGAIGTGGHRGTTLVHRLSWALQFGPVPRGVCVLHRCDNPPCVRPDHLFLGTKADNNADALAKGRVRTKLSKEAVLAIRSALASGRRQWELADEYGVDRTTITAIARRKNWAHLPEVS